MSVRGMPPSQTSNGNAFASQMHMSNNDSAGSGAEGRARKRVMKTTSDKDAGSSRQPNAAAPLRDVESKSYLSSGRRMTRDYKPPLGPRPADFSPSKSDNLLNASNSTPRAQMPSSFSAQNLSDRSAPSTSAGAIDQSGPSATGANPRVKSGSFDFLPSVSFDDLHSSISSNDFQLNDFPAPGGGGILAQKAVGSDNNNLSKPEGTANGPGRFGRTGSFSRRQSAVPRPNGQVAPSTMSTDSQAPTFSSRARRQSQFSSVAHNNAAKPSRAPRKSIGPGVLETGLSSKIGSQRRRPSIGLSGSKGASNDSTSSPRLDIGADSETGPSGTPKSLRNVKAKSFHPTPGQSQDYLSTPSLTPDHNRSASIYVTRSPGGHRTTTPSSSSKRMSMMPPNATHATGLGARTISPTDARRMKRMSMLQDPPPMPMTPPTQPESVPGTRSAAHSPSMIPRKSTTPSSSRTTPEHSRKSYSSGLSISSSTSYNSVRTSTGSLQPRLSQSISASRLPTPKTRNTPSAAGGEEEEVPPVPAIPKAYESPKDLTDRPFYGARKSSLPLDTSSVTSTSPGGFVSTNQDKKRLSRPERDGRSRKGPMIGSSSDAETKTSAASHASRRNLPPLRLPPINVLPLSTPTIARVASFRDPAPDDSDQRLTPPPKRGSTKTPSTPLTASKATFFSQRHPSEQDLSSPQQMRSSSSTHHARNDSRSFEGPSSSSASLSLTDTEQAGRQTITPFISSSLPKSSGDFSYMRPKDSGNYNTINLGAERASGLNPLRGQASSSAEVNESAIRPGSPTDRDSPASTTSMRRKLSLNFKRSSSKSSQTKNERNADQPPRPPKHDDMPPPKLPASATWTSSNLPSPSPPVKTTSHLSSRRRKSSAPGASNAGGHDRTRSDTWSSGNPTNASPRKHIVSSFEPDRSLAASKTTSSLHRILGSKNSWQANGSKQPDLSLDRDDMSAEEEMKKLASKRKGFEAAAREVDGLRRRASPKERLSAAQALRTVNLNIFERGEIVDYKEIYFCGNQNAKKHVGDLNAQAANFGYDDDRGDYNIVNGDHLSYRYEVIDILGKGSFGQVVRCIDHKTGVLVAVKIIRNKKRFHQQALVEVNILQKLKEWDPECRHSMVSFTQSFYFRGHLCISTELLGMNLYEFIKSNDFNGFSLKLIRRFSKQLLSSLVLLQSYRVIHCDLKPENILLAHPVHSEIKVIDFGSSCFENERVYTYIQSRFYRSPEVILGMTYGMPIDMWSLGCILAELYTGVPIFPGENEQEQLACIMEVFGPPEKHLIEKSTRKKLFFDSLGKPRLTVSSKGRRRRPSSKTLQQALKCDDEAFLDFINRCLRWDPDRRIKPDEALQHEFITGVKKGVRGRAATATTDSPLKKFNSVLTPSSSRPLPEPPATSFKHGNAFSKRNDAAASSPVRPTTVKRHSTVTGLQSSNGVKRSSTGAAIGSNLPRVSARSTSGKGELAATAAAVAIGAVSYAHSLALDSSSLIYPAMQKR
ncbi:MAG: hypothetical protein M4579_002093 [Chaenotheca gracillima]|nr:MAG: hypothetical protein M4579_002093 [Chaenotheca gracillima]